MKTPSRGKFALLAVPLIFLPGGAWSQSSPANAVVTPPASAAAAGATAQATPDPAAPANLDTVYVTATKTGRTAVQSTPIAVSVFSGDKLNAAGTNNIQALAQSSPSLKVGEVTASPSIYIRGVGTNNVFNGSDPNVSMLLDGVYLARPFQQYSDFFDVDRVEVLRGPQGTTFGRNAVGGVVNIISITPGANFEGRFKQSFGNYGLVRTEGFASGPLVDGTLAASIAVNREARNAYEDNVVAGKSGVADAHRQGLRAQLRWTPNSTVEATTRLDYYNIDQAMQSYDHILAPYRTPPFPPVFAVTNSLIGSYHKVALDFPGHLSSYGGGIAQDVLFKLSDNLTLRSITAYRDTQYALSLDADASEFRGAEIYQAEKAKQFSQEFNLTYNSKQFDGVAGLYYISEHNITDNVSAVYTTRVYNHIAPDLEANSKAVFAQGSYHFDNGVSLEFGGRYTQDTKRFKQSYTSNDYSAAPALGASLPGFPFIYPGPADPRERDWSAFTPKVGINWKASPQALLYATYAEGFKSGGFNYAASNAAGISFNPEKLKSLEAGFKTQWLDRKLLLNLTAFDYDYTDLQVQQAISPGNVQIANAATATVRGLELETEAKVTPRFTLSAKATWLDAKYNSFRGALVPNALVPFVTGDPRFTAGVNTYDASGNRLNNAPQLTYVLSARYGMPIGSGEGYVTADYFHQSDANFDPSNAAILREPGYGLLNLSVGYDSADGLWNTQLLVKNVQNRDYFVLRAANGLVPSAPSGAPRTVTVSVMRRF